MIECPDHHPGFSPNRGPVSPKVDITTRDSGDGLFGEGAEVSGDGAVGSGESSSSGAEVKSTPDQPTHYDQPVLASGECCKFEDEICQLELVYRLREQQRGLAAVSSTEFVCESCASSMLPFDRSSKLAVRVPMV